MTTIAACTLADGLYLDGAGVLGNSLYRNGYRGTLWIGYRGALPSWAAGRETLDVADDFKVRFLPLESDHILSYCKARMILRVLDLDPSVDGVAYFDSDIVLMSSWPFFEYWADTGAAVVVNICDSIMPPNHPLRRRWIEFGRAHGLETWRPLDYYFNSGFLAVTRKTMEVAAMWDRLLEAYATGFNEPRQDLRHGSREDPFSLTDQDLLNVALMATGAPISAIGPEGMNWLQAGYAMSHAIVNPKPWRRSYLRSALSGFPPQLQDKEFWKYADGPIRIVSPLRFKLTNLEMMIATAIGRFYRRN